MCSRQRLDWNKYNNIRIIQIYQNILCDIPIANDKYVYI